MFFHYPFVLSLAVQPATRNADEKARQKFYQHYRNYSGIITAFLDNKRYPRTSEFLYSQYLHKKDKMRIEPLWLRSAISGNRWTDDAIYAASTLAEELPKTKTKKLKKAGRLRYIFPFVI